MLEVGRVVRARREQHALILAAAARRHRRHRFAQHGRIHLDRRHCALAQHGREHLLHHVAVLEHVRDARRRAHVVLEHEERAGRVADQIDPRDVDVHAARRADAAHRLAVALRSLDERARHPALVEDPLIAVHVGEEQVERVDALLEPAAHRRPLRSGDDARDQIEREDPLGRGSPAVHRERHAAAQEGGVGELLAAPELVAAELVEPAHDRRDRRMWTPLRVDEFVERARQRRVSLEEGALLRR